MGSSDAAENTCLCAGVARDACAVGVFFSKMISGLVDVRNNGKRSFNADSEVGE